jgi:hypothetical protein
MTLVLGGIDTPLFWAAKTTSSGLGFEKESLENLGSLAEGNEN